MFNCDLQKRTSPSELGAVFARASCKDRLSSNTLLRWFLSLPGSMLASEFKSSSTVWFTSVVLSCSDEQEAARSAQAVIQALCVQKKFMLTFCLFLHFAWLCFTFARGIQFIIGKLFRSPFREKTISAQLIFSFLWTRAKQIQAKPTTAKKDQTRYNWLTWASVKCPVYISIVSLRTTENELSMPSTGRQKMLNVCANYI